MSLKELEAKIKDKNISGVYLLYGEEEYDKNRYLEKIKKCFENLELGVNHFILDKVSIDMLADLIDNISFFGEKKLIVLKGSGLKINTILLEELGKDTTIVILQDSVDKRTSEWKYLNKNAMCVEFEKLNEKNALAFIIKTLKAYEIIVSNEVAEYLIECCTTDKLMLINEFKKITSYFEKGTVLKKEHIDKICVKTLSSKVFDMLDLAVNKKKSEAVKKLTELFDQKEQPIGISIMLFKQVKQMYLIKLAEKEKIDNISAELKIHPFVYRKLKYAVNKYSEEQLKRILKELSEYDEKSKIGEMDAEKGLIQIVMSM
ncbi:MAG: DNA polymerase III subunit delta [Clostridia bacterium]|nr:DNA polymerase III subunit delta [Clostridia bacterium]MDD4376319.1 DNA polymerase III subunit delta [Clostridia bacterium]